MNKCYSIILLLLCALGIGGCDYVARYPIDKPALIKMDTRMLGIWKLTEDTSTHNYFVIERKDDFNCKVTYMNRYGENPQYAHFPVFFSMVDSVPFFNVSYRDYSASGYFFLKILEFNVNVLTVAMYADSNLLQTKTPGDVRESIHKNLNDPRYFKQVYHFRKVFNFTSCISLTDPPPPPTPDVEEEHHHHHDAPAK